MNHKATENTKKKARPQRHLGCMHILKWVGIIVAIIAVLVSAYYGSLFMWLNQGTVISTIPQELIPTAEYLLENPEVNPPLDDSEFFVGITEVDRNLQQICFVIASGNVGHNYFFDNNEYQIHAKYMEIFINGELAGRADISYGIVDIYRLKNGYTSGCIDGVLNDGLHLIELRAIDSAFGTPNYYKRWAIQVDCRYAGCVQNAAPSEFLRARYAWHVVPLPDEMQAIAENLLENPNDYDEVEISITDLDVPTFPALELCFNFHDITASDGALTLNGRQIDMYTFYFEDGSLCRDYGFSSGLLLIQLDLDVLDQVYEWAIEIE